MTETISPTLSERLRSETRQAHTATERSGIMQGLLRGAITRQQYLELALNLDVIYTALEQELDRHATLASLAFIDRNALRRTPALQRDIASLRAMGVDAPDAIRPASERYATRLHDIAETDPALLGAHAYVRYLGDLSGGQILKRIIAKALDLPAAKGTEFYEFPDIPEPDAFKKAFRSDVDRAAPDKPSADAFIAEALHGFALHEQLFNELA